MPQKGESVGNPETDRVSMGFSTTFLKDFHMGCCEVFETGCEVFGSGQEGGEDSVPEMGTPEVLPQEKSQNFPGFWGGTRDDDVSMLDNEGEDQFHEEVQGPLSPLDYVIQNLQCRLGNPRNRCFANSAFRLWAWAGSFMEGPRLWSRTASAVKEALLSDDVVQLTTLAGLQSLWTKFDDSQQNDASHFLQELVDLAESSLIIQSYHQVDFHQQVSKKRAFPVHLIFPSEEGPEELEHLIAEWANQQEGQVFEGSGLWVGQIGRYTKRDGAWTKYHRPLQVPSIFNLPITTDGNSTRTQQFSVIGYLCHSGNEHQHGHFYALFLYRGLSWLVDDGLFPRALPGIQDSLKQQIVQVWAVPSDMLLPSNLQHDEIARGPKQSEPAPKKRCSEGLSFDFANVTNMGQQVRQWLVSRPRQSIFVVETHLGPEDHRKMLQWMTARGYGAMGAPAAESPKGGTHGGMMMLFPQHLRFHYVQEQLVDGCGWFAVSWNFDGL